MERKVSSNLNNIFFDDSIITDDNVKDIGEIIAISALKITMAYSGKALSDLYAGLIQDVFNIKSAYERYSDGYDIACTAICFLYGHIGKRLNDEFKTDKKGRIITIKQACYRETYNFIDKQRGHIFNTVSYDNLKVRQEPFVQFEVEEKTNTDIDEIIDKMGLSNGQKETLDCYMAGLTFLEISRLLSVNPATVWKRRMAIQRKYNDNIAAYGY